MKLTDNDLTYLAEIAIEAACEAGFFIKNYDCSNIYVQKKNSGESKAAQVLTEVDKGSQDIILKKLQQSFKLYDLGCLAEESVDDQSRFEKDFFWCVDPLDGTLAYIDGDSGFAVSIALVSKAGVSQLGVVFDPVTKTLYHAIKGKGAFKNYEKFNFINHDGQFDNSVGCFFDKSLLDMPYYDCFEREIKKLFKGKNRCDFNVISYGGAVMNACAIMEQKKPAVYFKFPKENQGGGCLWDYAATSCIFKEAGLFVSDIMGRDLNLNQKSSLFMNESGILFTNDYFLSEDFLLFYKTFKKYFQPT